MGLVIRIRVTGKESELVYCSYSNKTFQERRGNGLDLPVEIIGKESELASLAR
jgi:hypothetical protein